MAILIDQLICPRCEHCDIQTGKKAIEEIDVLIWSICARCEYGHVEAHLLDSPAALLPDLLKKTSLPKSECSKLAASISRLYERDVEWAPAHVLEIPWQYVKAAEEFVKQRLDKPPCQAAALAIGSRYRIPRAAVESALYEQRYSDSADDGVANHDAEFQLRSVWPLILLDARGLIHYGEEIWRTQ